MEQSLAFSLLSLTLFVICNWSWGFAVRDADFHGEKLRNEVGRCETHFKMKLMSLDGEWESYVHYAAEDGTAVLPHNNCEKVTWFQQNTNSSAGTTVQIQRPMTVGNKSLMIGHQNGEYKDFYGVLTVTMTQKPNDKLLSLYKKMEDDLVKRGTLSSPPPKMCVFYIGATGPGHPVLYVYGFHSATCTLENPAFRPFILTAK